MKKLHNNLKKYSKKALSDLFLLVFNSGIKNMKFFNNQITHQTIDDCEPE